MTAYTTTPDHNIQSTAQGMTQTLRASEHLHCVMNSDGCSPDWWVQLYMPPYAYTRSMLHELRWYFLKKRIIGVREESRVQERDFGNFQKKPCTGRFSNGRIPLDFLAEILGLKEALPHFLDPNLEIEDLLTESMLSVEDQLNMFNEYIGKLKAVVGEARTTLILAKSLFTISMGSNDIAGTYFMKQYRRDEYNVEEYTTMLVNISSNFLQDLKR
ncbi:hypothetical protein JHK85_045878 [Glycine max]|nr:hypothetical protein JHK85_045878 [Glycine max]